jgi:hypothetical protein
MEGPATKDDLKAALDRFERRLTLNVGVMLIVFVAVSIVILGHLLFDAQ